MEKPDRSKFPNQGAYDKAYDRWSESQPLIAKTTATPDACCGDEAHCEKACVMRGRWLERNGIPPGFAPTAAEPNENQALLDAFIARAGFNHGWVNLESWARRMAEQAIIEATEPTRICKTPESCTCLKFGYEMQKCANAAPVQTARPLRELWLIAQEHAVEFKHDPHAAKELGYVVVPGFPLYESCEHCMDAIKEEGFELGWVAMRVSQLLPTLAEKVGAA